MKLGEKLKYLREVEGTLRGYGRALTQLELVAAIKREIGASISQSYLSQIENGARPHLTNGTRMLLSRFFRVHPGYLVDDPEGYHVELMSDLRAVEDKLDLWIVDGAERFGKDAELSQALLRIARYDDSRSCVLLLGEILDTPNLAERLLQVLKPDVRVGAASSADLSAGLSAVAPRAKAEASGAKAEVRTAKTDVSGEARSPKADKASRRRVTHVSKQDGRS